MIDHREEIRRLVSEVPDEPTHCEFKRDLGYRTKKEKGELVKDVSSFANIDLDALGGYGYIIFGVAPDGEIVGVENLPGDPPSELRGVINGYLDRPILFKYITCEVDDGTSGSGLLAALVIPDSRRRPHVVSRELTEQQQKKTKTWLRRGEVWVRRTGGRELATAEDIDMMYEGKLRTLVEAAVKPISEVVARLERDVSEMRSAVPDLSLRFAVWDADEPLQETLPTAVVGNLISSESWDEAQKLLHMAKKKAAADHPNNIAFGPVYPKLTGKASSEDYREYAELLQQWMAEVEDLSLFELLLLNTGQSVAEDVEVVLEVPTVLRPQEELPEKPELPTNSYFGAHMRAPVLSSANKQNFPDSLFGPYVEESRSLYGGDGITRISWEVGRLYHGRLLTSRSYDDDVEGLLFSTKGYRELLNKVGGTAQIPYTIHAANLKAPVQGALAIK